MDSLASYIEGVDRGEGSTIAQGMENEVFDEELIEYSHESSDRDACYWQGICHGYGNGGR